MSRHNRSRLVEFRVTQVTGKSGYIIYYLKKAKSKCLKYTAIRIGRKFRKDRK